MKKSFKFFSGLVRRYDFKESLLMIAQSDRDQLKAASAVLARIGLENPTDTVSSDNLTDVLKGIIDHSNFSYVGHLGV